MNELTVFYRVFCDELCIAMRLKNKLFFPLLFFVLVGLLYAIGMAPNKTLLQHTGLSVIWTSALLSGLLSMDQIFRIEYEEGVLDQWLLSSITPIVPIIAKILGHWCTTGFPLVCCSPLLVLLFDLPIDYIAPLSVTLLIGTLIFCFMGAIGAALTLSTQQNTTLLGLLIIPLYIPTLLLGLSCTQTFVTSLPYSGYLLWLLVLLVLVITLAPTAILAAIKIALS